MKFEFATANRVVFGAGTVASVPELAKSWGGRALIVSGTSARYVAPLAAGLQAMGITSERFEVAGEPTVAAALDGVEQARRARAALVVGIGGGSVLDMGKAVAALLTNGGEPLDYLEVVGRGQPLTEPSAPYVAIPTTAGTGAEVTRNAVLYAEEHRVKVSLRSPTMLPRLAVVDPELTYSVPPEVTAATGLDALTQLLEPFVSRRANPLTDALCLEGLRRAATGLPRAVREPTSPEAREQMAVASLFGGLALANAGLGAVHGFAGPLGGMLGAPHGVLCARLLPFVMEANVAALAERAPDDDVRARYDRIARLLTGRDDAVAADGSAWIHELCVELDVPPLRELGLREAQLDEVVDKAKRASSMMPNPVELTEAELRSILARAL